MLQVVIGFIQVVRCKVRRKMNRGQIILQEISGTALSQVNGRYVFRVFVNTDEKNRY